MAAIGLGATALATGGMDALIGQSEKVEDKLKAIGGIGAIGVGIALEFPAIAKIALIGTAIATATIGIILFRKEIGDAFAFIAKTLAPVGDSISKFFTEDIPKWGGDALNWLQNTFGPAFGAAWDTIKSIGEGVWNGIKTGFLAFWNGMVTIINAAGSALVAGINGIVAGVVAAINFFIDAYNTAAAALGKGGLSRVPFNPLSYSQIPLIAAANGAEFVASSPMLMLVGERGRESVSVRPGGGGAGAGSGGGYGSGGGGGNTYHYHYNIEGSMYAERDLESLNDGYHRRERHRRGWKP